MEINTKKNGYCLVEDGKITHGEIKTHDDVILSISLILKMKDRLGICEVE